MDRLTNHIKKVLENRPTEPPEALWNSIQTQLDLNDVWQNIEADLDVNTTWLNIKENLEAVSQIDVFEKLTHVVSAAVILIVFTFNLNLQSGEKNPQTVNNDQFEATIDASGGEEQNSAGAPMDVIENSGATRSVPQDVRLLTLTTSGPVEGIAGATSQYRVRQEFNFIPPLKSSGLGLAENFQMSFPDSLTTNPVKYAGIIFKPHFYTGLTAGIKNNWLLNSKTANNFKSDELNSTLIDFSPELGIMGGYQLTQKLGLQLEYYMFSGEGQKYQEYIGGQYLPTGIDLKYHKLELLAKIRKNISGKINQRISNSIIVGIYAGMLTDASEYIGRETFTVTESFSRFNAGVVGGYEAGFGLSERVSVHPSVRLRYGLHNIYRDQFDQSDFLSSSRTTSVSLNLTLRYNFFGQD